MVSSQEKYKVRLRKKSVEAEGINSFEFVDASGNELPAFTAGSHVDVMLDDGLVRQYSLCNSPLETHRYILGVLLDEASRGGSKAMHRLQEGEVVTISAPRNHFSLADGATSSLLIAGGIGVTPILSMAESLFGDKKKFSMHYCARSRARMAFANRIEASGFAPSVSFHFDDQAASQKFVIEDALARACSDAHLYVCGPKGFMDWVLHATRSAGWQESRIHYEFFAGEAVSKDSDSAFDVRLARSGRLVRVAKDQSVVQALAAAGIEVPMSCEQGVCGTCLTRVLDGMPDHRDMYMTPDEHSKNDQFTPCCSRSKTAELTLDL